uniref:Uncharacterized protein n=1 Tax=Chromera velia CCMP2878 TaxID=1169474 RepID=A0A0G4FWN5_9ALVE|eukprot:Cvel_19019.t1-p1 / transcript=Cvel_19019.t1 / gene=Cvel_19019 / organism=Chromera_velia_CCMP2878 / gene_product=hypothetical protein / transcript_product=hypothetical protein / location=Cvel_scaffold1610:34030-39557(+) / protein_length=855 / sequence_SO=supercontig / SO=protein_coding / is_pseudo=false
MEGGMSDGILESPMLSPNGEADQGSIVEVEATVKVEAEAEAEEGTDKTEESKLKRSKVPEEGEGGAELKKQKRNDLIWTKRGCVRSFCWSLVIEEICEAMARQGDSVVLSRQIVLRALRIFHRFCHLAEALPDVRYEPLMACAGSVLLSWCAGEDATPGVRVGAPVRQPGERRRKADAVERALIENKEGGVLAKVGRFFPSYRADWWKFGIQSSAVEGSEATENPLSPISPLSPASAGELDDVPVAVERPASAIRQREGERDKKDVWEPFRKYHAIGLYPAASETFGEAMRFRGGLRRTREGGLMCGEVASPEFPPAGDVCPSPIPSVDQRKFFIYDLLRVLRSTVQYHHFLILKVIGFGELFWAGAEERAEALLKVSLLQSRRLLAPSLRPSKMSSPAHPACIQASSLSESEREGQKGGIGGAAVGGEGVDDRGTEPATISFQEKIMKRQQQQTTTTVFQPLSTGGSRSSVGRLRNGGLGGNASSSSYPLVRPSRQGKQGAEVEDGEVSDDDMEVDGVSNCCSGPGVPHPPPAPPSAPPPLPFVPGGNAASCCVTGDAAPDRSPQADEIGRLLHTDKGQFDLNEEAKDWRGTGGCEDGGVMCGFACREGIPFVLLTTVREITLDRALKNAICCILMFPWSAVVEDIVFSTLAVALTFESVEGFLAGGRGGGAEWGSSMRSGNFNQDHEGGFWRGRPRSSSSLFFCSGARTEGEARKHPDIARADRQCIVRKSEGVCGREGEEECGAEASAASIDDAGEAEVEGDAEVKGEEQDNREKEEEEHSEEAGDALTFSACSPLARLCPSLRAALKTIEADSVMRNQLAFASTCILDWGGRAATELLNRSLCNEQESGQE